MRTGHLLFSCLHLLMIIVFLAIGGLFLDLHYLPRLRYIIADWLMAPHELFFFCGSGIILLTILFAMGLWAIQRHQFLRIGMKDSQVFVDENLVRQTIFHFWKINFPEQKKLLHVFFARQKIEIVTPLPQKGDLEQNLKDIETKLGKMLTEKFGYQKEFFVSVVLPKNQNK